MVDAKKFEQFFIQQVTQFANALVSQEVTQIDYTENDDILYTEYIVTDEEMDKTTVEELLQLGLPYVENLLQGIAEVFQNKCANCWVRFVYSPLIQAVTVRFSATQGYLISVEFPGTKIATIILKVNDERKDLVTQILCHPG